MRPTRLTRVLKAEDVKNIQDDTQYFLLFHFY